MVFAAPVILLAVGFVSTGLLTMLVLQVAHRRALYAVPNARSSHTVPTPSLGGVGIVLPLLVLLLWLWWFQAAPVLGLFAGTALLAIMGLWDDLVEAGAGVRLLGQVLAVGAVCWALPVASPWLLAALAFALLWHVNLFNFMDGIDGYAGSQCLFFALGAHLLLHGALGWSGWVLGLLSGCALGFLVYNWAPAKLFMGDVGSAPLGLVIGTLVAYLWLSDQLPLIAGLLLLAGFWFDASYTLCVRMLTGQRFTQAHRSHLYQHLAQRYGHAATTGLFWLHALVWLLPLAWLSMQRPQWGPYLLLLAVVPMAVACVRFGAGFPGGPGNHGRGGQPPARSNVDGKAMDNDTE